MNIDFVNIEYFFIVGNDVTRRTLKKTAVPSKFKWTPITTTPSKTGTQRKNSESTKKFIRTERKYMSKY